MSGANSDDDCDDVRDALDETEHFLRRAVALQRETRDPDHGQFYVWGHLLTVLAEQVEQVVQVVTGQLEQYPDRHRLRDDLGLDPSVRVQQGLDNLAGIARHAGRLRAAAAAFHSSVGHLGVEYDDEADGEDP